MAAQSTLKLNTENQPSANQLLARAHNSVRKLGIARVLTEQPYKTLMQLGQHIAERKHRAQQ